EVSYRNAHTRLQGAIEVECHPGGGPAFFECSVTLVLEKETGCHVTGDIDVRPAVVVEVRRRDAEPIAATRPQDAGFFGDIGEGSVAVVVIKNIVSKGQAAGAAHDGDFLPDAEVAFAGLGGFRQVEIDVVGDEQIEVTVPVVVEEAATGAVPDAAGGKFGIG